MWTCSLPRGRQRALGLGLALGMLALGACGESREQQGARGAQRASEQGRAHEQEGDQKRSGTLVNDDERSSAAPREDEPSGLDDESSAAVQSNLFAIGDEVLPPLCEGSVPAQLGARIEVQIWAPESLARERLLSHTQALARSMRDLGITFESVGKVRAFDESALFINAGSDGARALAEAERGNTPLPQKDKRALMATLISAPLRRLLHAMSPATKREVQLVFVDRIASIDSPIAAGLRHPAGLTLSPWLPPSEDDESLTEFIGVQRAELAAPVILLSMHELSRLDPDLRASTPAHEMGHAFGLSHGGGRANLMSPQRRARCRPGLQEAQIAILRANLSPPATGDATSSVAPSLAP